MQQNEIQNKNIINPLINPNNNAHNAPKFSEYKPEHFWPAFEHFVQLAKDDLQKIIENPSTPTFENTIEALEFVGEELGNVSHIFYSLLSAHSNDALQELAQKIGPLMSEFSNDILLNSKLFSKVKSVYENSPPHLNTEQKTLLENSYLDFTRNGALLNDNDKTKLREIDNELAKLSPKFSDNVLKDTNSFELLIENKNDLKGLPEPTVQAMKFAAEQKNKSGWLVTLQAPSMLPFLKYSEVRHLREQVWRAYSSRCVLGENSNKSVIKNLIEYKFKRANLLGYKNHAEFVLSRRMAGDSAKVFEFLDKLLKVAYPAAVKDLEEVKSFAKDQGLKEELMPWDFSFYSEKLRKLKYDLDEQMLKPYFQLDKVIDGVFEHASRLYDLEFVSKNDYPVYHEDVRVYEVYKNETKEFIGLFYADFYPRESKRGGAWMTNYQDQGLYKTGMRRPHVGIVCNFTLPTENQPSLLTFDEVQTLFHEFGHALHSLLSKCHYKSLSGTSVFWDFVELPSQFFENWTREKESLDLFAHHYKNGETIPVELTEKIKASSQFQSGYACLRQLNFALLDMAWYSTSPDKIRDLETFEEQATKQCQLFPRVEGAYFSPSFNHIFGGGYSAGYYSYKWAEVLDADAFELFKEVGLFNKEAAKKFEDSILSKGGTEHPMKLYLDFRGREPDPDALLRRDGLI